MSYWSHNPELYDEIIYNQMVVEGFATGEEEDIGEAVRIFMASCPVAYQLALRAEQEYWATKIDERKE